MNATLISHAEKQSQTCACLYSVAEAAEKLGVSRTTIRRQARCLGVRRIAGSTVKGFIALDTRHSFNGSVTYVLPYSE